MIDFWESFLSQDAEVTNVGYCLTLIFVILLIYNYMGSSVGVGICYGLDDTQNVVQFSTGRETKPVLSLECP
jgi:hypothetical protein